MTTTDKRTTQTKPSRRRFLKTTAATGAAATITTYTEAAFNEAVELATQGDEGAVLHLQRIAGRKDDSQKLCVEATRVLAEIGKSQPNS